MDPAKTATTITILIVIPRRVLADTRLLMRPREARSQTTSSARPVSGRHDARNVTLPDVTPTSPTADVGTGRKAIRSKNNIFSQIKAESYIGKTDGGRSRTRQ